jgi:hypothetical protein
MGTLIFVIVVALYVWHARSQRAKREDEQWKALTQERPRPSDCRNVQEVIDKYKPEGMGTLEFLASIGLFDHETGQVRSAPVEDILVGPNAPKEHAPKEKEEQ